MSDSARANAERAAAGMSTDELRAAVAGGPSTWKGCEFDDARVRHKHRVRLDVYQSVLEGREAGKPAPAGLWKITKWNPATQETSVVEWGLEETKAYERLRHYRRLEFPGVDGTEVDYGMVQDD